MTRRFNPPPTWPAPPRGWTPPPGWRPPAWGPVPAGRKLWVEDRRGRSPLQWVLPAVTGLVTFVFVIAGLASNGLGGGLLFAGLAVLLTGTGAMLVGRARWAFLTSRKAGAVAALAGLVALGTGVAIAPAPPVDTVAASTPPAETAPEASPAEPTPEPEPEATAQSTVEPEREPQRDPDTGLLDTSAAEAAVTAAEPSTALAALAWIEVKGRAPKTGYDRDQFGPAWADVDRNGCDTRNDILARDLAAETFKPGTRDCVVLTGALAEPYSGRTVTFQRGQGTSELLQIDHVVALSDAWQKGAQQWDPGKRRVFANDPLNLLAVDGRLNQQKGDGDAATWLPPNRGYRCAYVARQVAVKLTYGLWMTPVEKNASATTLTRCPKEPLPQGGLTHLADLDDSDGVAGEG